MGQTTSLPTFKLFKKKSNDGIFNFCKDCEYKLQQNTSDNYLHVNSKELCEERVPSNVYIPSQPHSHAINNNCRHHHHSNNSTIQDQTNSRLKHSRSEYMIHLRYNNHHEPELSTSLPSISPTSFTNEQMNEYHHYHHYHHYNNCHHCENYYFNNNNNQEMDFQGNVIIDNNTRVPFHTLPPPPLPIISSSNWNDSRPSISSTSSSLPSSLSTPSSNIIPIHHHQQYSNLATVSSNHILMDKPHEDSSSNKTLYHE